MMSVGAPAAENCTLCAAWYQFQTDTALLLIATGLTEHSGLGDALLHCGVALFEQRCSYIHWPTPLADY
jgi:hypothetical protein